MVDFRFTPEEQAFRAEVGLFIERECPPELRGTSIEASTDREAQRTWGERLAARGWMAPAWPKEYGGAGMTIREQFIFNLETARKRAPSPNRMGGPGLVVVGPTLIIYGTDEQKRDFISPLLSRTHVWCQGFSETEAGSDLAALRTRAFRDGDDYVINGQKTWTTLAHRADYMLLLARTDPDAAKHKGISYFIVPMKDGRGQPYPGITIRPLYNMANTLDFDEVFLENVRIPAKYLVGEENRGWYMAVSTLDIERSNIGAAVGQQQTVEDLIAFARQHCETGETRLSWDPAFRYELADRRVEAEISALLSFRIISLQVKGVIPSHESSAVKLFYMELNQRIASTGLRLLGQYGQLSAGSPLAPLRGRLVHQFLRSVANTIEGGTSEIQRNIIAMRGLGLPR